jgi:hypothetical protein
MHKHQIKRALKKKFKFLSTRRKKPIINEAVHFDKRVIFIAIPKTGTTSVRSQLKQPGKALIKNPHLNINQIRDAIYFYLLKETLGTNKTFPNADHPNDDALRQKAETIFHSFFKFSGVRNPWARAVSLYHRREGVSLEGPRLNDRMSFETFCENHIYASDTCRQPTLHKNQLDWLTSPQGDMLIDYVYKLEDYDRAIDEIKDLTDGRLILDNVKRNVNQNSKSRDYRDLYNDTTRKMIQKRFEKDIDYFKYTF